MSPNPALLRWARERAALNPDVVARRMKVDVALLLAWEEGSKQPTLSQLRKLAGHYRRPLAIFFLPEIPHGYNLIHDYRVPAGAEGSGELTPKLAAAIRAVHERREALLDWLDELPEPFPVQASLDEDSEAVAVRLRAALGVDAEQQFANRKSVEALEMWISAVERMRVLVFHEGHIEDGVMRGLSIPEQPLPVILLHGGDSAFGRVFTLLHELTHIALRQAAICNLSETQGTETFCNRVAAAILMPAELMLRSPLVRQGADWWTEEDLHQVAARFGVSDEALLLRLVRLGKARREQYEEMRPVFLERYELVQ